MFGRIERFAKDAWVSPPGGGLIEHNAWVAQLVEHFPEEEGVAGSSPAPSTSLTF